MRILNLELNAAPGLIGRAEYDHYALGVSDLEMDAGIIARRLRLVRDADDRRVIWSKRNSGGPTVEFDNDGRATVPGPIDHAARVRGLAVAQ